MTRITHGPTIHIKQNGIKYYPIQNNYILGGSLAQLLGKYITKKCTYIPKMSFGNCPVNKFTREECPHFTRTYPPPTRQSWFDNLPSDIHLTTSTINWNENLQIALGQVAILPPGNNRWKDM
jgi:hypothetical protein